MIRQQATRALKWSTINTLVQNALGVGVSLLMVRWIAPEAYGLVAVLGIFTGIIGVFVDSGFSAALIQRQEYSEEAASTVFWFNIGIALICAAGLYLGSSWIAAFFGQPELTTIAKVFALQVLLTGSCGVQHSLCVRNLDFRTPFVVSCVAVPISGVLGLTLAISGYGVWALVTQSITHALLTALLLWYLTSWRPAWIFSIASLRSMFRFGSFVFLSAIVDVFYNQLYALLIGKRYSVRDLGVYNFANNLQRFPSSFQMQILDRVAFPIFSRIQDRPEQFFKAMRMSIRGVMLLNIPMMFGLAMTARHLIVVVFGDRWVSAIGLVPILSIVGLVWPLNVINLSVLKAKGKSNEFFRLEVCKKVTGTTLVICGSFFGIYGLACAMAFASILAVFYNTYYTKKLFGYGWSAQLSDIAPIGGCAAIMAASIWLFSYTLEGKISLLALLIGEVALGGVVFGLMLLLFRCTALRESFELLRSFRQPGPEVSPQEANSP